MDTIDFKNNYQDSCDLKLTDGAYDYYVLPNNAKADPESRTIRYSITEEAERLLATSIGCTGDTNQLMNFLSKNHHGSVWSCSDKKLQKLTAELIINREIVIVTRSSSKQGHGTFAGEGPVEPLSDKFRFSFKLPCFGSSALTYKIVEDKSGDIIPGVFLKVTLKDNRFVELASTREGKIEIEKVKRGVTGFDMDVSNIFGATLENTFAYVTVDSNPAETEEDETSPNNAERAHARLRSKNRNEFRYIADITEHKVAEGETFDSIAEANGSTFRDLAFFNWGEYERKKIRKLMERDIGCSQKTPDGRDYQFTGEEDPGIVYIPAPLSITDLETNMEHTIRVKRVGYKLSYLYQVDLDDPEVKNDTITLFSDDNSWEYTICLKDLEEIEENWVELIFPSPPKEKTYSMIHSPGDEDEEDSFYIFKNLDYDSIWFDYNAM